MFQPSESIKPPPPQKKRGDSRRVLNPKVHVTTLINFGTLRSALKVTCPALTSTAVLVLGGTFFKPCLMVRESKQEFSDLCG